MKAVLERQDVHGTKLSIRYADVSATGGSCRDVDVLGVTGDVDVLGVMGDVDVLGVMETEKMWMCWSCCD